MNLNCITVSDGSYTDYNGILVSVTKMDLAFAVPCFSLQNKLTLSNINLQFMFLRGCLKCKKGLFFMESYRFHSNMTATLWKLPVFHKSLQL